MNSQLGKTPIFNSINMVASQGLVVRLPYHRTQSPFVTGHQSLLIHRLVGKLPVYELRAASRPIRDSSHFLAKRISQRDMALVQTSFKKVEPNLSLHQGTR